jgi:hypothetical protein
MEKDTYTCTKAAQEEKGAAQEEKGAAQEEKGAAQEEKGEEKGAAQEEKGRTVLSAQFIGSDTRILNRLQFAMPSCTNTKHIAVCNAPPTWFETIPIPCSSAISWRRRVSKFVSDTALIIALSSAPPPAESFKAFRMRSRYRLSA